MHILFNFPTRSRVEKFVRACNNIADMIQSKDFTILVKCDTDDPCMVGGQDTDRIKFAYGTSTGKIHSVNRDVDKAAVAWDVLISFSDDMKILKK